jgi:hypothetical protein
MDAKVPTARWFAVGLLVYRLSLFLHTFGGDTVRIAGARTLPENGLDGEMDLQAPAGRPVH